MAPPDGITRTSIRVRYGDVDRQDVAHHVQYLTWFEIGRTDWLRARGLRYKDLEDDGTFLVVIESQVAHLAPARYDDVVEVRTWLAETRRVRLTFAYEIWHGRTRLATGRTRLAATNPKGRPMALPARIVERLGSPVPPAGVQGEPAPGASA